MNNIFLCFSISNLSLGIETLLKNETTDKTKMVFVSISTISNADWEGTQSHRITE